MTVALARRHRRRDGAVSRRGARRSCRRSKRSATRCRACRDQLRPPIVLERAGRRRRPRPARRFTAARAGRDRAARRCTGWSRNRFRAGLSMLGHLVGHRVGRDAAGLRQRLPRRARPRVRERLRQRRRHLVARARPACRRAASARARRVRAHRRGRAAASPSCRSSSPRARSSSKNRPSRTARSSRSYLIRGVAPDYGADAHRDPAARAGPVPGRRGHPAAAARRLHRLGSEPQAVRRGDAVGQSIRIRGMAFEVIGVMKEKAQLSNYFRPDKECIFIPYTVASQLWYQPWLDVIVWQAVDPTHGAEGRAAGVGAARQAATASTRPTSARCATGARRRPRRSRAA